MRAGATRWATLLALGCALGTASLAASSPGARTGDPRQGATPLPRLDELVRLAALDPPTAARLVPASLLDAFVDAVLAAAAEEPALPSRPDPPLEGPIGPWPSPAALAQQVAAADPLAVAALYRAMKPRLAASCRTRGTSLQAFERAMAHAARRLSAPAVVERAAGGTPTPLTPAQRELARLGVPSIVVIQDGIGSVASALWGERWREPR